VKIKKANTEVTECDMTPMIDMTFQLIAFLMILVNFSAEDVSAKVVLPESELAKPPDKPTVADKIVLQFDKQGRIIVGAETVSVENLKTVLSNEAYLLQTQDKTPSDATIIVRAHRDCPTGKVQEVIKNCQEKKFDKFILRAKEKE